MFTFQIFGVRETKCQWSCSIHVTPFAFETPYRPSHPTARYWFSISRESEREREREREREGEGGRENESPPPYNRTILSVSFLAFNRRVRRFFRKRIRQSVHRSQCHVFVGLLPGNHFSPLFSPLISPFISEPPQDLSAFTLLHHFHLQSTFKYFWI